jgi:maleate cis-trans isomerase
MPTLERAKRHYENKYGLQVLALECFSGADFVHFASLGPEAARDAMARADRPEIEALVIPGGNFPTMRFVPDWERQFGKPVITANQAALWAMLHVMKVDAKLLGLGRLLEEMPTMASSLRACDYRRDRHPGPRSFSVRGRMGGDRRGETGTGSR